MQLIRKFRLPALFCALAVLVCELVSHPYTNIGICDDWPYILMAQKLAITGHVAYNGWTAAMLGWQLYLGAAFIKLFGFSLTTVRMSTLLVAMAMAVVLQRTLVRANISERNATIGTLALVLSPLYLMLSVTFMSDITGLFAIVLCLYGCLRALQASTSRATIGWLCFAVATNAICGTSRQIAWLGILVMVPSTLWLLRAQRRVLLAGTITVLAGVLFIFGCMHWLKQQPYVVPYPLLPNAFPIIHAVWQLIRAFLDLPFLLLPLVALFIPAMRRNIRRSILLAAAALLVYAMVLLDMHGSSGPSHNLLEPTLQDWVSKYGIFAGSSIKGEPPLFLDLGMQILLTVASLGGLLGLFASFCRTTEISPAADNSTSISISWKELLTLLAPFSLFYWLLLVPGSTTLIFERYLLAPLVVGLICLVRYYQDRVHPRLPLASIVLVAIMAIYGVTATHNTFAVARAHAALTAELSAAGIHSTSVDNGWEYNLGVELQHAAFINDSRLAVPAHAYVPTPPLPARTCPVNWYDKTPHIRPLYSISFDPNACYGPAPFAPITYSRWLASKPGTLYVVNSLPPSKQ